MLFSTLIADTNLTKNSNLSSSLLSLDLSDLEKQFDNDLDLDKADKKTLNKYVLYRLTQYTLLDSVDYDL
jgi:type VI protein secretion system component Hcp